MSAGHHKSAEPAPEALERGFETADVKPRGVVWAGVGLIAGAVTSGVIVALFVGFLETRDDGRRPTLEEVTEQAPPEPHLQVDPLSGGDALRAEAEKKLVGYGWVDSRTGIAHVPIERAMELIAAAGWPDKDDGRASAPQPGREAR